MTNDYHSLLVDNRGDICWVTINRSRDRNSINTPLMEELTHLLSEMEKRSIRAMVFRGAGTEHFIGGADGIEMMQMDQEGAFHFSGRIQQLFNRMEASPLITVAAITGLCFGGGFEFALACDLRLAADEARIGLPEVKVGLIPGGGGTQRLPRLVGIGRAMEMILSGRLYHAQEALEMGLIHRVVPNDRLPEEVETFLKIMLRHPSYTLPLAKKAVYASQSATDFRRGYEVESTAFRACFAENFFVDLMIKQLRDGSLTTTAELPDWVRNKKGD